MVCHITKLYNVFFLILTSRKDIPRLTLTYKLILNRDRSEETEPFSQGSNNLLALAIFAHKVNQTIAKITGLNSPHSKACKSYFGSGMKSDTKALHTPPVLYFHQHSLS